MGEVPLYLTPLNQERAVTGHVRLDLECCCSRPSACMSRGGPTGVPCSHDTARPLLGPP